MCHSQERSHARANQISGWGLHGWKLIGSIEKLWAGCRNLPELVSGVSEARSAVVVKVLLETTLLHEANISADGRFMEFVDHWSPAPQRGQHGGDKRKFWANNNNSSSSSNNGVGSSTDNDSPQTPTTAEELAASSSSASLSVSSSFADSPRQNRGSWAALSGQKPAVPTTWDVAAAPDVFVVRESDSDHSDGGLAGPQEVEPEDSKPMVVLRLDSLHSSAAHSHSDAVVVEAEPIGWRNTRRSQRRGGSHHGSIGLGQKRGDDSDNGMQSAALAMLSFANALPASSSSSADGDSLSVALREQQQQESLRVVAAMISQVRFFFCLCLCSALLWDACLSVEFTSPPLLFCRLFSLITLFSWSWC